MTTRTKFTCNAVMPIPDGYTIYLNAVYQGSPENEKFFHLTPGGHIAFSVVDKDAAQNFKVGKEYYVDLIPVEADES